MRTIPTPTCYTGPQVRAMLQLTKNAFTRLRRQGKLPFVVELVPRPGRYPRYRAADLDRYLAGEFIDPVRRYFPHHHKRRVA